MAISSLNSPNILSLPSNDKDPSDSEVTVSSVLPSLVAVFVLEILWVPVTLDVTVSVPDYFDVILLSTPYFMAASRAVSTIISFNSSYCNAF